MIELEDDRIEIGFLSPESYSSINNCFVKSTILQEYQQSNPNYQAMSISSLFEIRSFVQDLIRQDVYGFLRVGLRKYTDSGYH